MTSNVKDQAGDVGLDHFAILVQGYMLPVAVSFFVEQLGWEEDEAVHPKGDWGEARFVSPGGEVRVQLTQLTEVLFLRNPLQGAHLALRVEDPTRALEAIRKWAGEEDRVVDDEALPGGKVMIWIPAVFATQFELVPN